MPPDMPPPPEAAVFDTARPSAPPPVRSKPVRGSRWRWLLAAALAIAGLAALAWFMVGRSPAPSYVTQPVTEGRITRAVSATGVVNPQLTITVGTYVSGVIQTLYCDYNTQVRAGQICAKIDPRPFQATFDQASAQLLRDRAILAKDEANLVRYRELLVQDSIARQTAEDQVHVVAQDHAAIKVDEAAARAARLNLGYTNIVSPVNGTVVSRNVTQGQTVAASLQTPTLFLIATDLKKMQIDTNISEGDIGEVRVGQRATFTVDAYPQRVFEGVVTQVRKSPQTVQNVVTYDAVVTVDNPEEALMPGMTASTQIVVAQSGPTLRVPNQALRYTPGGGGAAKGAGRGGGARVWVLRGDKAVAVPVRLGLDDGVSTQVLSGDLSAADRVITGEQRKQKAAAPRAAPMRF